MRAKIIGGVIAAILVAWVMVANAGWEVSLVIIAFIAAVGFMFGVLPYLLGSRSDGQGGNGKGYFYGYSYKYGAQKPKF